MINLYENKENCCGCGSCVQACRKNAIALIKDEYDVVYPEINAELCVECGLCKKVCAFQNIQETNEPLEVFAASGKDPQNVLASSSGGIFGILAACVLENNGVVFGSSLEKNEDGFHVKHIRIQSKDMLKKIQGSKYVQSSLEDSFKSVKAELLADKTVLFSGTPCQVAGLKAFLGKCYDNLYTVDVICHGVPSKEYFENHIDYMQKKRNIKITDYNFRDKQNGWNHVGSIKYRKNNQEKEYKDLFPTYKDSFYSMFIDSEISRPSCYKCKYTCKNRPGDITLGDYWGIASEHPEYIIKNGGTLNSENGISAVIINTEKGRELFGRIKDKCNHYESSFEKVSKHNSHLRSPSKKGNHYDKIHEIYCNNGWNSVEEYYSSILKRKIIKKTIRKMLPIQYIKIIKKKLRK